MPTEEQVVEEAMALLQEIDVADPEKEEDEAREHAVEVAPAELVEADAAEPGDVLGAQPKVAEVRFALGDGAGELRYSITGQYMRAYCPIHEDCVRQRATREHPVCSTALAAGQGRPLGALTAWLSEARDYPNRVQHVAAKTASYAKRLESRTAFYLLQDGVNFSLQYERARRDGEDDEPEKIR